MLRSLILSVILFSILLSCDNSVDPLEQRVEGYTIYGILNLRKDTSFIRVRDINIPLIPDSGRDFEGTVRLRNLTRGTEEILKGKEIVYENITTHNFYSENPIEEITDYQIEVERDGRVITTARTTTPSEAELTISNLNPTCRDFVEVSFDPVLEGEAIVFNYGFEIDGQVYQLRAFLYYQQESGTEYGFRFFVESALREVVARNQPALSFPPPRNCSDLVDQRIFMDYIHYGPDFIQDTNLDSVFIPGSFIRFGGLYDSTFTIPIDTTDQF